MRKWGKIKLSLSSISLLTALMLMFQSWATAEYYEYIDENGVKTFTEDLSQVPTHKIPRARVHKERYDDMEEEEKNRLIQMEEQKNDALQKETKEALEQYRQKKIAAQTAEQQRKEALKRQKKEAALKTPVWISNNQIIVPVNLKYKGRQITVTMLLDTGANITTMLKSTTEQLGIDRSKKSAVQVAGGAIIRTQIVRLDKIQVGPSSLTRHSVMVFKDKNPSSRIQGLLGQDFLGQFDYTIDYKNSVIKWAE